MVRKGVKKSFPIHLSSKEILEIALNAYDESLCLGVSSTPTNK